MQSNQTWKIFYQKLGHLCYAVAAADNNIAPAEVDRLKQLVTTDWVGLEGSKNEFGDDSAFQIEIVFDWLREKAPSSDIAFAAFSEFYKEHHSFFNDDLKKKILETANAIASAFHGENKAEHQLLVRLKHVLDK